ncbi:MAG: helix-turn-helix transcriptional regulator [Clostridia bacterium]|nr:helix-turn-helix transcriptional regulator [Clostridia bacterium]
MDFYKEFLIDSVSIIVRKKEKPFFKRVFTERLSGNGFVYFLSGYGTYTDKNGRIIPFGKDDFLLVEHGAPYTIETDDCESEYITTAFSLDKSSSYEKFGLPTFFSAKDDDRFRLKVLSLLRAWEKNSVYSKLEARLMINEIFLDIRKAIGGETALSAPSPVSPAIEYINRYYNSEITPKVLAKLCLMSESYFRSQFRKHMGVSPLKYRESVRISWAKQYLATNLFSITEIAEKLGYCDIYHFSKVFRQHCGITPSEYKKGL